MRVLICAENIFSAIGGGQSFYADLIRRYPAYQFWYFSEHPEREIDIPVNAHAVRVLNHYRRLDGQVTTEQFAVGDFSLEQKKYDLLYMLDLASAVLGLAFDVVDIPDYMGYAAAFPAALKALSVPFERVAVSMHGTLSMGVTDNWAEIFDEEQLAHIRHLEDLLFRGADIRYAISSRYLAEREAQTGVKGSMLDLTHLLPLKQLKSIRAKAAETALLAKPTKPANEPAVAFIGRQEKWKGPDLFLDMVAGLPRATYSAVELIGPALHVGDVSSAERLRTMAERRSIDFAPLQFPREVLWETLATGRRVAVTPSRRDTLNLSALEALLAGTPTLISVEAGVVDYLDQAFPGLPYARMDPADLTGAMYILRDLLGGYDTQKAALLDYLAAHEPIATGGTLADVYAAVDPEAHTKALYGAFADVMDHLVRSAVAIARVASHDQLSTRVRDMFSDLLDEQALQEQVHYFTHVLQGACELRRFAAEKRALSKVQGLLSDSQMGPIWDYLQPFCYSADRVAVYRLLADLEKDRGNFLLYATYQVRCMRLSGRSTPALVEEVAQILVDHQFPEEAEVVRWMYGDIPNLKAARAYLDATPTRFLTAPQGDVERVLDERTIAKPKISIIVSLYRAASKLDVFFEGLSRLTERTRTETEIVLVDSFSPDDTFEVVQRLIAEHRAAGWNVSVSYIRSSVRETIQRAWNRGIAEAKGEYLSFLGVDEMNRPDAFEIMADYLDGHPSIDWVQGTALVTEVNERGSFVQDLFTYDRRFHADYMNLFDTCYIGYVGALYRKNIHDRVGYYDDRFRGAGDSEFKNRVLPHISAVTLPQSLGIFLNYPEERTTQSPMAEIEDIRAWYLYRSTAGAGYMFSQSGSTEIETVIRTCMDYRKSYMDQRCTDLELATSVIEHLGQSQHELNARVFAQGAFVKVARDIYRALDQLSETIAAYEGVRFVHEAAEIIERGAFALATTQRALRFSGLPVALSFRNDNRSHQHHYTWASRAQRIALELGGPLTDLAGPQDLAELLSACGSLDQNVDFERAHVNNDLDQIKRLWDERSLDIAVEWNEQTSLPSLVDGFVGAGQADKASLVVLGARAPVGSTPNRVYFSGPVARPGPGLAASKGILVWADSLRPGIGAERLLRAIVLQKPIVADPVAVSELSALCPTLDLSIIPTAETIADAVKQLIGYVGQDRSGSLRKKQATLAAAALAHPLVHRGGFVDGPDMSSDKALWTVLEANRAIRGVYGVDGVDKLFETKDLVAPDSDGLVRHLLDALLVSKTAPILQTEQLVFRQMRREEGPFIGAKASANV